MNPAAISIHRFAVTINYIFYEEMEREEMEGEAMKTKRRWKVETQFEYSTLQRK